MAPSTYSEPSDGGYMGMDQVRLVRAIVYISYLGQCDVFQKPHTVWTGGRYQSDMSIWDIHRTQMPLLGFVAPEVTINCFRGRRI
jgi:hypothetical protein